MILVFLYTYRIGGKLFKNINFTKKKKKRIKKEDVSNKRFGKACVKVVQKSIFYLFQIHFMFFLIHTAIMWPVYILLPVTNLAINMRNIDPQIPNYRFLHSGIYFHKITYRNSQWFIIPVQSKILDCSVHHLQFHLFFEVDVWYSNA